MVSSNKAQTATEYIIIVAVVIVIALVVVQIMGGFPGIGSGTTKKVSDYKLATTGEIGIDKYYFGNNSVLLTLKNNNFETLVVNNLTIRGITCVNTTPSLPRTLNPGQVENINCSNSAFLPSMNDDATPSLSATYYNPSTGASYSTNYAGVSSNGSLNSPAPTYNCTGLIPGNATLCINDDINLTNNVAISIVSICGAPMCEYTCNLGYSSSGGNCLPSPVFISTLSGNFSETQDLIANVANYSSAKTYAYNWYKGNSLNATTLNTNGLIAYLPFNNNTNDYFSGNNGFNNGAVSNATFGVIGGSYYFNGANCVYNYTVTPSLNGNKEFTMMAWINPSIIPSSGKVIMSVGSDAAYSSTVSFVISNIGRLYTEWGSGGVIINSNAYAQAGKWYHIALVYNKTNAFFYVNGTQDGTAAFSASNLYESTYVFGSSRHTDGSCNYRFTGYIDEGMVFNRSLSALEIKQLYDGSRLGGSNLSNTLTTDGDIWKVGFNSNSVGGNNWAGEVNSSAVTITS